MDHVESLRVGASETDDVKKVMKERLAGREA